MSTLLQNTPLIKALLLIGLCVLHFLWQGALIAVLWRTAVHLLHNHSASARYAVSLIALLAMLACPAVTALRVSERIDDDMVAAATGWPDKTPNGKTVPEENLRNETHTLSTGPDDSAYVRVIKNGVAAFVGFIAENLASPDAFPQTDVEPTLGQKIDAASKRISPWLPWLAAGWITGVVLLTCLHTGGFLRARRLCHDNVEPCPEGLTVVLCQLKARLRIRRNVRLLQSARIAGPSMIGWLRPVILLPPCSITGLKPDELSAVLLHELAHIRRHDYMWNVVQTCAETVLFFHPAVWWVSARIRTEREHCCDDLVLAMEGEPRTYATALMRLEELRHAERMALAATDGPLLGRIRRIVASTSPKSGKRNSHGPAIIGTPLLVLAGWLVFQPLSDNAEARSAGVGTRDSQVIMLTKSETRDIATYEPETFIRIKNPSMRLAISENGISLRNLQLPVSKDIIRQTLTEVNIGSLSFSVFGKKAGAKSVRQEEADAVFELLRAVEGMTPVVQVRDKNIRVYAKTEGDLIRLLVGVVESRDLVVTFRVSGRFDPDEAGERIGHLIGLCRRFANKAEALQSD